MRWSYMIFYIDTIDHLLQFQISKLQFKWESKQQDKDKFPPIKYF